VEAKKMKKKIIGFLICTLVFASTITSASVIKNENRVVDNNIENRSSFNLGDKILSPPWSAGGYWDGSTSEFGFIDGEVTYDGYGGNIYLYAEAIELGHASVYGYITHHPDPYYVAPYDGYYDFTLTYEYNGFLDITVFKVPGFSDAFLEAEIVITFTMRVMSSPHVYEKEITLAEDVWREDEYIDWSNIKDESFNDIYVTEGTEVFFSATMYVENMHAAAGTVSPPIPAYAKGKIDISGSLLKIKIEEPTPPNRPPDKPSKPSGPTSGKTGNSYTYSTSTTDPDGDSVSYKWDWHDETSGWIGSTASHTWDSSGTYLVKVKAKDTHDAESEWSDPLQITVKKSKNKQVTYPLLHRFLKLVPNAISILRLLQRLLNF